ncbi:general secretion pathway protein C [Sphingomonas sp. YR710]|uniref:type II secretion system protein N n=1 Tax=Sphingomonas sp. YR710 TaxID=1882773 RepID=UPI00087F0DAB|nr:type II secretion system protein N [Sphingomonas sp. YR710]SDD42682.1 general secretion pathway protein C [Sphingomonas sp. YR710]
MLSAWHARAWPREVSQQQLLGLGERAAIALLALLGLAVIWAVIAPTGRSDRLMPPAPAIDSSPAIFGAFDPFFRLSGGDGRSSVVTPLNITLYGIRADRASGRGAAIIGLPDGTQNSYAVGDAIMPGVVLAGVTFDSVTIRRNGAAEKLYLDQSQAAPVVGAPGIAPPPIPAPSGPDPFAAIRGGPGQMAAMRSVGPPSLLTDMNLSPRQRGDRIDGYILQPSGTGDAFRAAGFRPGDVLVAVNGTRLIDAVGTGPFAQAIVSGGSTSLQVERDGRPVTVTIGRAK